MTNKTIVISAVNLRRGGTLRILKDCLSFLSSVQNENGWRIVALVHCKELADFPGIEYIEMPDIIKGWGKRLWCEYVTMHKISKQIGHIDLWFSLHDTTPRVVADRQAVYCQTSYPFLKLKLNDLKFDYKIVLFGLFTRLAYRINIHRNYRIVVQADWLRSGFSKMFGINRSKFIVAPPEESVRNLKQKTEDGPYTFAYVSQADCHKNFELVCEAARIAEGRVGAKKFRLDVTIDRTRNKYGAWVQDSWKDVNSINFRGFIHPEQVNKLYSDADCLIFPSRVETWGLPISEFKGSGKPMLLADLPYAKEAAAGASKVGFFPVNDPQHLADQMLKLIEGDESFLNPVAQPNLEKPFAMTWDSLFDQLMSDE